EETLGEVAVVVGGAAGAAHLPVPGDPPEPRLGPGYGVHLEHEPGGLLGAVDPCRLPEHGAGFGERGDRQTVPGGDHLVVEVGLRATVAGRPERLTPAGPLLRQG